MRQISRTAPAVARRIISLVGTPGVLAAAVLMSLQSPLHAEREFRVYRSLEAQADVDLPPDYEVPGEFVVGRLMYPPSRVQTSAATPFWSITFNSFSDGPLGFFSPISHF